MLHSVFKILAGALCLGALLSAPASAQSLVGTLKCTADVVKANQPSRDWKLACAFEPVKGQVQHYAGAINDPGRAPRETGKAFLVWNVLAQTAEVEPSVLVGTYKEGKAGANGLVGGQNGAILLQAAAGPNPQDGVNVAPRVNAMQLELPRV